MKFFIFTIPKQARRQSKHVALSVIVAFNLLR